MLAFSTSQNILFYYAILLTRLHSSTSKELLLTNGGSNPCWILDYYNIRSSAEVSWKQQFYLNQGKDCFLIPKEPLLSPIKLPYMFPSWRWKEENNVSPSSTISIFLWLLYSLQEESHAVFARSDTSKVSRLPYLEQVEKVRIPNFQEFSVFLHIVF